MEAARAIERIDNNNNNNIVVSTIRSECFPHNRDEWILGYIASNHAEGLTPTTEIWGKQRGIGDSNGATAMETAINKVH